MCRRDAAVSNASEAVVHNNGDMFWVAAGQLIFPILNAGEGAAVVQAMWGGSDKPIWTAAPAACNPSTIPTEITFRSYLEREGCGTTDPEAGWWENPSPHTRQCVANGGVQVPTPPCHSLCSLSSFLLCL
jgi:hypothetical protein